MIPTLMFLIPWTIPAFLEARTYVYKRQCLKKKEATLAMEQNAFRDIKIACIVERAFIPSSFSSMDNRLALRKEGHAEYSIPTRSPAIIYTRFGHAIEQIERIRKDQRGSSNKSSSIGAMPPGCVDRGDSSTLGIPIIARLALPLLKGKQNIVGAEEDAFSQIRRGYNTEHKILTLSQRGIVNKVDGLIKKIKITQNPHLQFGKAIPPGATPPVLVGRCNSSAPDSATCPTCINPITSKRGVSFPIKEIFSHCSSSAHKQSVCEEPLSDHHLLNYYCLDCNNFSVGEEKDLTLHVNGTRHIRIAAETLALLQLIRFEQLSRALDAADSRLLKDYIEKTQETMKLVPPFPDPSDKRWSCCIQ